VSFLTSAGEASSITDNLAIRDFASSDPSRASRDETRQLQNCQSASNWDALSASKRDPFVRRVLGLALAPSALAGIAEMGRAPSAERAAPSGEFLPVGVFLGEWPIWRERAGSPRQVAHFKQASVNAHRPPHASEA